MMSEGRDVQVRVRTLKQSVKRVGVGAIAVALLTLVCYRTHIDLASAIPLFLLLVVMESLTGDFRASVIVAALSAVCLDFFLTQPLFSLRVANPLNAFALLAFVVTALVVSRLETQVHRTAKSVRVQKERLDRLYGLSQQLLALNPEEDIGESFLAPFHRLFGVEAVCVFEADTAEPHTVGDSQHGLSDKTRDAYIQGHDRDDPATRVAVRCLRVGGKLTGAIGFEGLEDPGETAGPLTVLTASLLERTKAFRTASKAAAAAQTEVYRSAILDALAHEFKTPLATILAAAGVLREVGPLEPAQIEMTETVENETERLATLTSRLLRTARLDREEVKPRIELTDVTSLVALLVDKNSARASDRRVVLSSRREEIEVMADPGLLRLALNQLIDNAFRYSQPGSTVTIEIERQSNFVVVRVSNTGSSIPREEHRRVFERFYRGVDSRNFTSGSGLGLYVARKIALAHGGALDLETAERDNGGVTFCLTIPSTKDQSNHVLTAK